jgi:predicted RNase H-like HicB family nuclease
MQVSFTIASIWHILANSQRSEYIDRGLRLYHMRQFKVIVEKHVDGYVAYPLGLKGIVVGEGDTYEEALADVKSAIQFHIDTFGQEVFDNEI